ncbi:MAG: phosphatase PAP2 family protein [Gaiellaceae bacterium]
MDVHGRRTRAALEIFAIAALYLGGELFRGLADGGRASAVRHADDIVRVERQLHVFDEAAVQRAVRHVYGLSSFLGYAYLTVHLAVTVAILIWVYRSHRPAYGRVRNVLAVANALGVVGYTLFPTAPPRLAGIGVADTVSHATSIDITSSLASSFYNPYAAFPSMHIGFALIAGASVWKLARRPAWRAAGAAYPLVVLLAIVATGNHFFLDAAAGAAVAAIALAVVLALSAARKHVGLTAPSNTWSPYGPGHSGLATIEERSN